MMIYLVQKEADMFVKVRRSDILSRSMEADMFVKAKRSDILSRSMEADMFAELKVGYIFSTVWLSINLWLI